MRVYVYVSAFRCIFAQVNSYGSMCACVYVHMRTFARVCGRVCVCARVIVGERAWAHAKLKQNGCVGVYVRACVCASMRTNA